MNVPSSPLTVDQALPPAVAVTTAPGAGRPPCTTRPVIALWPHTPIASNTSENHKRLFTPEKTPISPAQITLTPVKTCNLTADLPIVRCFVLTLFAAATLAQTPQELSIARQRQALDQQAAALRQQDGPLSKQAASIEKQKASVATQPARAWAEPAPAPTTSTSLCPPLPATSLDPIVERAAASNALSPSLLRAVIRRESAFQPCAVSPAGALGLMQLMPSTAAQLGVGNPFDPEENIAAGSRFLRQLLDRFNGELPLALGAYNAGPARVEAAGGVPPIPETQSYVQAILDSMR